MNHEKHESDEKILFKEESYTGRDFRGYREMGKGFLKAIYQECLAIEFRRPSRRSNNQGKRLEHEPHESHENEEPLRKQGVSKVHRANDSDSVTPEVFIGGPGPDSPV